MGRAFGRDVSGAGRGKRAAPRSRASTLRDVARMASVDDSTASRVLRGDPVQGARPETRDRIFRAARKLKYRPNALARGLRTRRTETFGLIVPTLDNIGFADVIHGIQAAAADAGKLVVVIDASAVQRTGRDQKDVEESYARLILDGRVDGLLAGFAMADDPVVAKLGARHIPLVLVNRRTSGIHGSVVVDDQTGSRLGVDHLVELGHRRISYIGFVPNTDTNTRRRNGYHGALRSAGLAGTRRWEAASEPTEEGGRQALNTLLEQSGSQTPTAIFCASLLQAIGALSGLRAHGLRVPDDISVVAFNDHEFAAHTDPPLTTVRLPNFEMGWEAMAMLIRASEGGAVSDRMIEIAPRLIVRASTGPPRRGHLS